MYLRTRVWASLSPHKKVSKFRDENYRLSACPEQVKMVTDK